MVYRLSKKQLPILYSNLLVKKQLPTLCDKLLYKMGFYTTFSRSLDPFPSSIFLHEIWVKTFWIYGSYTICPRRSIFLYKMGQNFFGINYCLSKKYYKIGHYFIDILQVRFKCEIFEHFSFQIMNGTKGKRKRGSRTGQPRTICTKEDKSEVCI